MRHVCHFFQNELKSESFLWYIKFILRNKKAAFKPWYLFFSLVLMIACTRTTCWSLNICSVLCVLFRPGFSKNKQNNYRNECIECGTSTLIHDHMTNEMHTRSRERAMQHWIALTQNNSMFWWHCTAREMQRSMGSKICVNAIVSVKLYNVCIGSLIFLNSSHIFWFTFWLVRTANKNS